MAYCGRLEGNSSGVEGDTLADEDQWRGVLRTALVMTTHSH